MTFLHGISFFLCGVMMALMISGLIVSVVTPDVEKWNRKFFITLFTILTLVVISYFVYLLASMYSTAVVAENCGILGIYFSPRHCADVHGFFVALLRRRLAQK